MNGLTATRATDAKDPRRQEQPGVEELFYRMALIRRFEENLLELFKAGRLAGTTHTYLGQEATAVAALSLLEPGDFVTSQHRSHGYFIGSGGDPRGLFLEIIGDRDGVCNGIGGSQHLYTPQFLSNGILGGTVGVAAGIALAEKLRGRGGVVVSFIGDGTLGEGLTYEAFNISALWQLPILFVIENNGYAQTTPIALNLAGSIRRRPEAFGIATDEIESNDVVALQERFSSAFARVRGGHGPFCQIVHTYRLGPHSKGDDFRAEDELRSWRARDPIALTSGHLGKKAAVIDARASVDAAKATEMPPVPRQPSLNDVGDDTDLIPRTFEPRDGWRTEGHGKWMVTALQSMFAALLSEHPEVYLLGEDILDPYGGAFKVYRGLSTAFPDRVLTTPISEAAIVGVANGLALRGYRPIIEVMFGDFATLMFDQLFNHAAKFSRMYRNGVSCPVIVRVPSGGYRGYGPTHSQSAEKFFIGVPGLVVTASDPVHDPRFIWERMLALDAPCVHVENKGLYSTELPDVSGGRFRHFRLSSSQAYFPTTTFWPGTPGQDVDVTLIAYGGMVLMALQAAEALFVEHELLAKVVVPSQISPLPLQDLVAAIAGTSTVVALEEGTERAGWGAEVIARLACLGVLDDKKVARCAALDTIIPNNPQLEKSVLPSVERIVRTAVDLIR